MVSKRLQAIVLAAGKSYRFNTGRTKLLERICGQEMILYTTKLLAELTIPTTLVTGYQKESVQTLITEHHGEMVTFSTQEVQAGTGHAIMCSKPHWNKEYILIMNGDMPLVTPKIIEELYQKHTSTNAKISFVIAHHVDPQKKSYGRVVKHDKKIEIIEAKHFTGDVNEHCCINAGIYLVNRNFLQEHVDKLNKNEQTQEFYITDLVKIASDQGKTVTTITTSFDSVRGINTFQELWAVEQIKRSELIRYWMNKGVRFSVPQNVHVDLDVEIKPGTYIGCAVHLLKGTTIGSNCTISEFTILSNATIADNVTINSFCFIKDATVHANAQIGPFAHISDRSIVGEHAQIGNFVELKRTTVGKHTKAKHLTYLGDAQVGNNVNIGAGTITCNHNGSCKNTTTIQDNAYIGSNNSLVAPVTIKERAFTAAGSVITENVPNDALAIGRARQINKEGYAKKIQARLQKQKDAIAAQKSTSKETNDIFMGATKTDKPFENTDNC